MLGIKAYMMPFTVKFLLPAAIS